MTPVVAFFVPGVPAPGGSKKSFVNPKTGKVVTLDDAKNNKGWRSTVALFAAQAWGRRPLLDVPLSVLMQFNIARPKDHYGTGRNAGRLKASAPGYPDFRPDVLKLARSTEDALTGVIWRDDAATVYLTLRKLYGEAPGAYIEIDYA